MSVFVFLGPTLPANEARQALDATYLPPARQGDLYAVARSGARVIGLVDGFFETVPSVWHKEILWALTRGVHVFGAASMGALRAAETERYGMVGVGAVFEAFRTGVLEDDDEVAVVHGAEDTGFQPLSEAMVNIRATLEAAERARVLSGPSRVVLEAEAKRLYYPDRSYPALLHRAAALGLPVRELDHLRAWLARGRVDQKRADALAMLHRIGGLLAAGLPPFRAGFTFERTVFWRQVVWHGRLARGGAA